MAANTKSISTDRHTVGSLNPAHAIMIPDTASIFQGVKLMVLKSTDCLLTVDQEGGLSGIITDKDIAYKVIGPGMSQKLNWTQV